MLFGCWLYEQEPKVKENVPANQAHVEICFTLVKQIATRISIGSNIFGNCVMLPAKFKSPFANGRDPYHQV